MPSVLFLLFHAPFCHPPHKRTSGRASGGNDSPAAQDGRSRFATILKHAVLPECDFWWCNRSIQLAHKCRMQPRGILFSVRWKKEVGRVAERAERDQEIKSHTVLNLIDNVCCMLWGGIRQPARDQAPEKVGWLPMGHFGSVPNILLMYIRGDQGGMSGCKIEDRIWWMLLPLDPPPLALDMPQVPLPSPFSYFPCSSPSLSSNHPLHKPTCSGASWQ